MVVKIVSLRLFSLMKLLNYPKDQLQNNTRLHVILRLRGFFFFFIYLHMSRFAKYCNYNIIYYCCCCVR